MRRGTGKGHPTNQRGRAPVWKTILYMLLMGVICWWVAADAYSFAIKLGLSETDAARLPGYAFLTGLALGLGIGLVRSIKDVFAALLVIVVLSSVFWFIAVVIEAFLVGFGLSAEIAYWISWVVFGIGPLLGSITLYAVGQDILQSLFRRKGGGAPSPSSDANQ
ncbi:MAG TPA: hypothetical protein VLY24_12555 [Bryobacteraceae bacterium]|nr:hypothetical protein [Bryobacteraceae bacterium]